MLPPSSSPDADWERGVRISEVFLKELFMANIVHSPIWVYFQLQLKKKKLKGRDIQLLGIQNKCCFESTDASVLHLLKEVGELLPMYSFEYRYCLSDIILSKVLSPGGLGEFLEAKKEKKKKRLGYHCILGARNGMMVFLAGSQAQKNPHPKAVCVASCGFPTEKEQLCS